MVVTFVSLKHEDNGFSLKWCESIQEIYFCIYLLQFLHPFWERHSCEKLLWRRNVGKPCSTNIGLDTYIEILCFWRLFFPLWHSQTVDNSATGTVISLHSLLSEKSMKNMHLIALYSYVVLIYIAIIILFSGHIPSLLFFLITASDTLKNLNFKTKVSDRTPRKGIVANSNKMTLKICWTSGNCV